jgi:hypothetical protein
MLTVPLDCVFKIAALKKSVILDNALAEEYLSCWDTVR